MTPRHTALGAAVLDDWRICRIDEGDLADVAGLILRIAEDGSKELPRG